MLPAWMMQVHYDGAGGPEVLRVGEAAVPRPGEGQVLIAVAAAGVNRPDILQRAGAYPPPRGESDVPGLEVSGRIAALGANAEGLGGAGLREGDEVCALLGSGGYADYALADAALCLPRPAPLTLAEAGGLPEALFTVFDNVVTRGRLRSGERFLVHGGSSGIGTVAIQLAKALGAEVFTTAGSAKKCASCRTLGADHAINYREEDFAAAIRGILGKDTLGRNANGEKPGVDVVLDMVGGAYLAKNLSLMATEGRLVQIAFLGGAVAQADFTAMMVRRLTLTGSTLRARSLAQKAAVAAALRADAWPLVEAGRVKPVIHATFPLAEARQAQELMETSTHVGKILLLAGG